MQAAGNDYIYINLFEEKVENPVELSRRLSDRHFGVGSDGLVLIGPSVEGDFSMLMFNADGSEGLMYGNAARCVGKYLYEKGITQKTEIRLKTKSGIKELALKVNRNTNKVELVRVNMGKAILSAKDAGSQGLYQSALNEMIDYPIQFDEQKFRITFVSMGNPHAVVFTHNITSLEIEKIGPRIEYLNQFPDRTNVDFVEVLDSKHLKMRVWGRGSGETMSCGSGACAAVVAGVITGRCKTRSTVSLRGGSLEVLWDKTPNQVYLIGDAHFVYKGEI